MAKFSKKEQKKFFGGRNEFSDEKSKSGPDSRSGKAVNRKQAIAIGLSEAMGEETLVPLKKPKSKHHAR